MSYSIAFLALMPTLLNLILGRYGGALLSLVSFPLMLYHLPTGVALWLVMLVVGALKI